MICHFSVLFDGDWMKFHREFEIPKIELTEKAIEAIKMKAKKRVALLKNEYEEQAGEKKDISFYEVYLTDNDIIDGKDKEIKIFEFKSFNYNRSFAD